MGVSSTTNRRAYQGDGVTTAWAFAYYTFFTTDIVCYLYDTILGATTLLVLGVDYTISGTANFQGIYPNGVTVNTTNTVVSTSYLVIIRNPPETQTFNILENGIIPSQTLVQQMDYLTLLIQRLEDQISRCVQLSDGTGTTFSTALPANIPLNPGAFLQVNPNGNGIVLSPTQFQFIAVPFASLQTAGLTNSLTLFTLPAGAVLTGMALKSSVAFSGPSITDVTVQVGVAGTVGQFFDGYDVYAAVGDTNFDNAGINFIGSWATGTAVILTATAVGANLSALAAGNLNVYYSYAFL